MENVSWSLEILWIASLLYTCFLIISQDTVIDDVPIYIYIPGIYMCVCVCVIFSAFVAEIKKVPQTKVYVGKCQPVIRTLPKFN